MSKARVKFYAHIPKAIQWQLRKFITISFKTKVNHEKEKVHFNNNNNKKAKKI